MSTDLARTIDPSPLALPQQARTDAQLISLWLHGRAVHTQRAYASDVQRFLTFVDRTLRAVTLGDLQAFADRLQHLAPSSQTRILASIKSLLSFAHKVGYVPFNVGTALRLPKQRHHLAERILSEGAVQRMLALETNRRNHALLRLLYGAGLRVSEVTVLCWKDMQERGDTGQVVIFGKGGKTRVVLLSTETWHELQMLRGSAGAADPIFRSRKGGALDPSQVLRIIKAAARRAGLPTVKTGG